MKLFLDDLRNAPDDSWRVFRDPISFLVFLEENWLDIHEISLDHDLGYICPHQEEEINGYDVMGDIERIAFTNDCCPFHIHIHTANPVGRENMVFVRNRIQQMSYRHMPMDEF